MFTEALNLANLDQTRNRSINKLKPIYLYFLGLSHMNKIYSPTFGNNIYTL